MNDKEYVIDKNGDKVFVGDIVKVLEIDENITKDLEKDELDRVSSMLGEELQVNEIDKFGCAWVLKWFRIGHDDTQAHDIALEPNQMELVSNDKDS